MLEFIGQWTSKAKVAGSHVQEFHFGSIRIARIVPEYKTQIVKGKEQQYRMYQHRVYLPGVGSGDVGYSWSLADAKSTVEGILTDWLFEAGITDLLSGEREIWDEPLPILPESVIVLEGIKPPPASAKILPLEDWRREGTPRPAKRLTEFVPSKKPSHSKRRALTRGQ